MIMVDGFGIPPEGWEKSIYAKYGVAGFAETLSSSIPLDAGMDVDGIPQSATGQTALFCGVNAAAQVGAHVQGFPGPTLRKIIVERNIFSELRTLGLDVTFSNAYVNHTLEELAKIKTRSVTTVMTNSTINKVRDRSSLLSGEAVYHDLTRATLADSLAIPEITPRKAAEHLGKIAEKHDFTLFEYFLTDRAGHKLNESYISAVIAEFSAFFKRLIELSGNDMTILLTSDHGNCESMESRGHTANPVPLFIHGAPPPNTTKVKSIVDVFGFIVDYFKTMHNDRPSSNGNREKEKRRKRVVNRK